MSLDISLIHLKLSNDSQTNSNVSVTNFNVSQTKPNVSCNKLNIFSEQPFFNLVFMLLQSVPTNSVSSVFMSVLSSATQEAAEEKKKDNRAQQTQKILRMLQFVRWLALVLVCFTFCPQFLPTWHAAAETWRNNKCFGGEKSNLKSFWTFLIIILSYLVITTLRNLGKLMHVNNWQITYVILTQLSPHLQVVMF